MRDFFLESFQTYFGLDFLAMTFSLLSVYFLGSKKRIGFVMYLIANVLWIVVNTRAGILAGVVLNVVLIALNFRGLRNWKNK
ncbi:hypothetical protein HN954_05000 [bacterium]|mgnify:CR=1 FL=1|nr:hypothetical protein [bacterium]MBT6831800.1 hypothetical protein [bacterium]MBT6996753.1 hypothetical protein [bacterium]MBT7772201.1 hypothetical protein [bacterium]